MSPSEYWEASPAEVGLVYEYNRPKNIGHLHEDDYHALDDRRAELESQGYKVG